MGILFIMRHKCIQLVIFFAVESKYAIIILDKLDNLARGTYIIRVQAGETIVTQRLIK